MKRELDSNDGGSYPNKKIIVESDADDESEPVAKSTQSSPKPRRRSESPAGSSEKEDKRRRPRRRKPSSGASAVAAAATEVVGLPNEPPNEAEIQKLLTPSPVLISKKPADLGRIRTNDSNSNLVGGGGAVPASCPAHYPEGLRYMLEPMVDPPANPTNHIVHEPSAQQNNSSSVSSMSQQSHTRGNPMVGDAPSVGSYDVTMLRYHSNNIVFMNKAFKVIAILGICLWLFLIWCVYLLAPEDSYSDLNDIEYYSAILAGVLIFVSAATKCVRLILKRGWSAMLSGIMAGALAVQFIAMSTDFLMAWVKVPIIIDPVTRARVYLFRYCEWTPLAFMMTFFTEGVNVPEDMFSQPRDTWKQRALWYWRLLHAPILHASSQGISAFMGWVFPFCTTFFWWMVAMVVSCLTYLVLFPRLQYKRRIFLNMNRGTSVDEIEIFDRARLSYRLLVTCAVMWTVLVTMYYFQSFAHWFVDDDSILKNKSLPFVCEAIIDVMAKAMYMDIIVDVHDCVFDDGARSARRLEELRRMMSVVWECSSDVIALSVRGRHGTVTTMLSPTFLKLEGLHEKDTPMGLKALIFEQPPSEFTNGLDKLKVKSEYTCVDILDGRRIYIKDPAFHKATQRGLWSMRKLMVNAWNETQRTEAIMIHSIELQNGESVQCEGKLTRLEPNALVVVTRDISERYRRFEAEKRAVSELTARRKDAEANRFTRHEVKNGLLASIALCDTLKDTLCKGKLAKLSGADKRASARTVAELDTTLREVLDTVLAEAMARDVVHEIYEPRMERVDLRKILTCSPAFGDKSMQRFPLVTFPSPLPIFIFDPQLLRYIHRNAVSNACKYGKKGGVVLTEVHFYYENDMGQLELNVINLPGENHERLMVLGQAAQEAVFAPGKRLHTQHLMLNSSLSFMNDHASHSSGDGAWISRKCAKTLGGDCTIRFEPKRTIFTLKCPATPFEFVRKVVPASWAEDPSKFKLPQDTIGVAIDDSKIQRKLMHKFFSLVGIPTECQIVLGYDAEEIRGFNEEVMRVMKENPKSRILLIADENLDVMEDATHHQTISGSLCIERIRKKLPRHDERRLLALVRSANDGQSDLAVYKSRAHGFFPKAPIKRNDVVEILAPLWEERFPGSLLEEGKLASATVSLSEVVEFVSSASDLMQTLDLIDGLCLQASEDLLPTRWPVIWEKLHALKGDLKTFCQNELFHNVLFSIDELKSPTLPHNFLEKWNSIRSVIVSIIQP